MATTKKTETEKVSAAKTAPKAKQAKPAAAKSAAKTTAKPAAKTAKKPAAMKSDLTKPVKVPEIVFEIVVPHDDIEPEQAARAAGRDP